MNIVRDDPKADIVFYKIFGEHKHLCMSLLNALLPLKEEEKIVSIQYMSPKDIPLLGWSKDSLIDVLCKDQKGHSFIVMIQLYWTEPFLMKTVLNASKAYSMQTERGTEAIEPQSIYCLYLLDKCMPQAKEFRDEYRHVNFICHGKHKELPIGHIRFVFVELPKHHSHTSDKELDEFWLSFLTMLQYSNEGIVPEYLTKNKTIAEAVDIVKELQLTPEERAHYDKFWDEVSCERTLLSERFDQGKEEGEKIGFEKGELKGKQETARNLKSLGVDIHTIAQATGLTIEEINKL
ncbi:MAG: Rpn family recombination-promoting nuclease/putative transposase [Bacteroidales bacterium]|nr:Rpn family recombination-promoting nuclease/putative transposase [Bacteroidales bacterium]